jgi:hypothetical protein
MRWLWVVPALAACSFSPDLGDGTLACGVDRACPPGYQCAADDRCRRATPNDAAPAEDLSNVPLPDLSGAPDLSCAGNGDHSGPGGGKCPKS